MDNNDSLRSHLDELKRKHRSLDEQIIELEKLNYVTDEIRRLKTQKLWLKDEIYRIERQLETMETRLNGHA